jgi:YgiT-type zinc finger domain-containing protein
MKKKGVNYNYGECEICNTPMKERLVKQDFWIQGKLIVVEDVPAGVCPKCGEKVVTNQSIIVWTLRVNKEYCKSPQ